MPLSHLTGSERQALNILSSTVISSLESQTLLQFVTVMENTDGRHNHQGRLTSGQKFSEDKKASAKAGCDTDTVICTVMTGDIALWYTSERGRAGDQETATTKRETKTRKQVSLSIQMCLLQVAMNTSKTYVGMWFCA